MVQTDLFNEKNKFLFQFLDVRVVPRAVFCDGFADVFTGFINQYHLPLHWVLFEIHE